MKLIAAAALGKPGGAGRGEADRGVRPARRAERMGGHLWAWRRGW
jgi:hypothetical protein